MARALCPFGTCEGLDVRRARSVGQSAQEKIPQEGVSIEAQIPALDLAILKVQSSLPLPTSFTPPRGAATTGPVYSLGFPKCGPLTLSAGAVTALDHLTLKTSLSGAHGSSGSPVFDSAGSIVGIVAESDSIAGGLLSLFSDYKFEAVAIRADQAFQFFDLDARGSLEKQARFLVEHYRSSLRTLPALERLRSGVSFMGAVEAIQDQLLYSKDLPERVAFLPLGQNISYLPQADLSPPSALMQALSTLVLAYNLEIKGPFLSPLQRVNAESLYTALERTAFPVAAKQEWRELIRFAEGDSYPGLELYGMLVAAKFIALALLVISVLTLSAGYVFGKLRGSRLRRVLWSFACFLIWPIPLFVALKQKPRV